jgi:alcohol dehydrogenase
VIAVDIDDRKLARARELGAAHTVKDAPVETIVELTGGGAHVSLDALGAAVTCQNSIACLRRRGRHAQVGLLLADDETVPLDMWPVISHELRVFGVHGMAVRHYEDLLRAVAAGTVTPGALVAKTIGLEEAGAELESMGRFAQDGVTVVRP